jgi:hypothetical protein
MPKAYIMVMYRSSPEPTTLAQWRIGKPGGSWLRREDSGAWYDR